MPLPIEDLTPRQIVEELDRYIIGQPAAKRAVAVALRNRYRRQQLSPQDQQDVMPKNILMMGPTGVGKTEIARRLAQLARAPFIKVEATKFTEVGYVGRDVESMIRDLVAHAVRMVEAETVEAIHAEVLAKVDDSLLELILQATDTEDGPAFSPMFNPAFGENPIEDFAEMQQRADAAEAKRIATRDSLANRELEDVKVEVSVEESNSPFVQVFTPGGIEEMGLDTEGLGGAFGTRRSSRSLNVCDARSVLYEQESKKLVDQVAIRREAVHRTEQTGIIFLDEIDKVAGRSGGSGPDVSREGVQRDLLPIIEGSTVQTKFGPVRTDHILFIAAGAFHMSKPSDLIPELQGRLPIRVTLDNLSEADFRAILDRPANALTRQYQLLLATEGVTLEFESEALDELAKMATELNANTQNIGARRLQTVMERLLEPILFSAPEGAEKTVRYGRKDVVERLARFVSDPELSESAV